MTHTVYATPEEAEQAFYAAFEACDLKAMMDVWADREFVECIHPLSQRAQGREAVEASWRQIFDGGLTVRLAVSQVHRTQDVHLAVHVLCQHLSTPTDTSPRPPVIATNIYQLIDNSWRMILHHASPSSAESFDDDEIFELPSQSRRLH